MRVIYPETTQPILIRQIDNAQILDGFYEKGHKSFFVGFQEMHKTFQNFYFLLNLNFFFVYVLFIIVHVFSTYFHYRNYIIIQLLMTCDQLHIQY